MNYSKDPQLGIRIEEALREAGKNTPLISNDSLSIDERHEKVEKLFTGVMDAMGLDMTDDSLKDTPRRVAKSFTKEIFYGLHTENFPKVMTVENKMKHYEMVIEQDISVQSMCEHHFLPIDGVCNVAYFPKDLIIGLSKLNRIVEYFCKRPQIQERLSEQIAVALSTILETEDVAVVIKATHHCVRSRGIKDINSTTTTSVLHGRFQEERVRSEFLNLLRL